MNNINQSEILTTFVPKDNVLYFGVQAVVVGDFYLKAPISTHTHGFKVFISIEDGVYKILLLKKVDAFDRLKIKGIINNEYSLFLVPEEKAYDNYIQLLHHIEAIAGFNYGIRKILYQDTLELLWYVGNPVFENLTRISIAKQQFKQPKLRFLSESNLSSIVLLERVMPEAIIPYNFYREAMNYLTKREYRLAYLHFYMILEYCFISDNNFTWKNESYTFEHNLDIEFAILQTIKLYKDHSFDDFEWLTKSVRDRFKYFTVGNVLKLLFRYRGEIAHGTKKSGHYSFNESELADITRFIHQICLTICGNMQVYCEAFTKSKNERLPARRDVLKMDLNSVFDKPGTFKQCSPK